MKRFLTAALVLSLFSVCTLSGCSEDTTSKKVETVDTPNGTVKETTEKSVEKTGDMKDGATPTTPEPPK